MKSTVVLRKITVLIACMLFCPGLHTFAQEPDPLDLKFDHVFDLGSPGGQTMIQDNDGFLWVGTEGGGIFRYDGYELKNYGAGPGLLPNSSVFRIVEELQREQPERRVELVIVPGLVVDGDARLLQVALENLLGNAWKFSGK